MAIRWRGRRVAGSPAPGEFVGTGCTAVLSREILEPGAAWGTEGHGWGRREGLGLEFFIF